MKKYGFVYIWYDKKHKRFYIGCRWGDENDGYVCSSTWMKQAYKHRPQDFRRKILARIYTSKKDLLEEEYRWLSKIKKHELKTRYYNLSNRHFGHWSATDNKDIIASKCSWNKGKIFTEAEKEKLYTGRGAKISAALLGKKRTQESIEKQRAKLIGRKANPEHVAKRIKANTGKKRTGVILDKMRKCAQNARNHIGAAKGTING